MNEAQKEMLFDILEDEGYLVETDEPKFILARKSETEFYRIFIEIKYIDCVRTRPGIIDAANRLSYPEVLEFISTFN